MGNRSSLSRLFESARHAFSSATLKAGCILGLMMVGVVGGHAVLVDPAYYTGSRSTSTPGQLLGTADWGSGATKDGFKIAWSITYNPATLLYSYRYDLTDKNGGDLRKDISHWILEVSPIVTSNEIIGANYAFEAPVTYVPGGNGGSNPNLPANIYGIKFDNLKDGDKTFTFTSPQKPIWGDFYAKDGQKGGVDVTVSNVGFGTEPPSNGPSGGLFDKWIAIPDSEQGPPFTPIPEPGTALFGIALAAASALSRSAFRRK